MFEMAVASQTLTNLDQLQRARLATGPFPLQARSAGDSRAVAMCFTIFGHLAVLALSHIVHKLTRPNKNNESD